MRGDSLAHGAARSEKSPSLLIEKNPVSNAFGARHSVCVRHSCALPSYRSLIRELLLLLRRPPRHASSLRTHDTGHTRERARVGVHLGARAFGRGRTAGRARPRRGRGAPPAPPRSGRRAALNNAHKNTVKKGKLAMNRRVSPHINEASLQDGADEYRATASLKYSRNPLLPNGPVSIFNVQKHNAREPIMGR